MNYHVSLHPGTLPDVQIHIANFPLNISFKYIIATSFRACSKWNSCHFFSETTISSVVTLSTQQFHCCSGPGHKPVELFLTLSHLTFTFKNI